MTIGTSDMTNEILGKLH